MGPKYELAISVTRVRQLPERLFRGGGREHQPSPRLSNSKPLKTLYAKGTVIGPGHEEGDPEQPMVKVSGPGVWDYGKQGDAKWGNSGVLRWKISEIIWLHIRSNNPKVVIHLYLVDPDNPSVEGGDVGWFVMDVRKFTSSSNLHKIKLQGCAPAIVEVSGSIKVLPRRASIEDKEIKGLEKKQSGIRTISPLTDMDALPIGPSSLSPEACTFCFTVNIRGASNMEDIARNMNGDPPRLFWFSYSLFGVLVQTDQFSIVNSGGGPPPVMLFVPVFDTFLLRATPLDLIHFFESMPALRIFLCTEGLVVAHADVQIGELLPCAALRQAPMEEKLAASSFETECPLVSPSFTTTQDGKTEAEVQKGGGGGGASLTVGFSIKVKEVRPVTSIYQTAPDLMPPPMVFGEGKKNEDVMAAATITGPKQTLELPVQINSIHVWVSRANLYATGNFTEPAPARCVGGGIVFSVVPMRGKGVAKVVEKPTVVQTIVPSGEPLQSSGVSALLEFHPNKSTPPPESAILYIVATCMRGEEGREIGRVEVLWPGSSVLATETELPLKSSDGVVVGTCTVGMRKFGTERERAQKQEHLPFVPAPGLRHLHLTVKLVSIQCLDSTEYVVANYHYPRNMGSVPIRTAVSRVNRHGEATLLNAVSSRSFVMSLENFATCVVEEPIVVSLKAKERNGERDLGYAKLPLEELVSADPQRFVILKSTNHPRFKQPTLTPLSHNALSKTEVANRQTQEAAAVRKGENDVENGGVEPVQVRVLDQYLDVLSAPYDYEMDLVVNGSAENGQCQQCRGNSSSVVSSLHVVLILKDFGLAEEKDRIMMNELDTAANIVEPPSSHKGRATAHSHPPDRRKVLGEGFHQPREGNKTTTGEFVHSPRHYGTTTTSTTQAHCTVKGNMMLEMDTEYEGCNASTLPMPPPSHGEKKKAAAIAPVAPAAFHPHDEKGMPDDFQPIPTDDGSTFYYSSHSHKAEMVELARLRDEWETWRTKEEIKWWEKLRQKEMALRAKWKEREAERAYIMVSASEGYTKLETRLRKALHEVESRERSLKSQEESLRMEYSRKVGELELLQSHLADERQHQLEVENTKVKDLKNCLAKEKNEVMAANVKVREVQEEFDKYCGAQRKTPEGILKADVMQLQAIKAGLETALERERSEKHKALLQREEFRAYIHKLGEALQRHQEKDAVAAKRELEQLRLDYLAREERFMLDGDREELQRIKHELECLKSSASAKGSSTSLDGAAAASVLLSDMGSMNERLLQWRSELLKQGNSPEHPVIRDIDRQIGFQCLS